MQFSTDWFSRNTPQWAALMNTMRWCREQPLRALEIGSFEGRSAVWLLQNVLVHPDSRLFCVDTFGGGVEHGPALTKDLLDRFRSNIAETGSADKVSVRQGLSSEQLLKLISEGEHFDFIYVDGSHQAKDVLEDLVLSFRLAKVGALIVCDDYLWSMEGAGHEDILNSPKLAIDAFTNIYRRHLVIPSMQQLYQLAFVKTRD